MEWIEPVDVKSAAKFTSSMVNSTGEVCQNIVHGSIIGKKEDSFGLFQEITILYF